MRRQKTAREILDAATPEKELQNTAIELFHNCGWLVNHQRPAIVKDDSQPSGYSYRTATQGDKGFLDTVAAKAGYVVFFELKKQRKKMSPEQEKWYAVLKLVEAICYPYVRVFLWKPSDWDAMVAVANERIGEG